MAYESMATVPSHRTSTYVVAMRAGWRWAVCAADGGRPRRRTVRGPVCAGHGSRRRLPPRSWSGCRSPGPSRTRGMRRAPVRSPSRRPTSSTTSAALLSGRTQMRVWWQSATDWRADTITPAGERSTRTTAAGSLVWDYEDNRVVRGRTRCRQPGPAAAGDRHPSAGAGGPDAQRGDPRPGQRAPGPPGRRPAGRGPASCGRATRSAVWAGSTCGPTRRPGSPSSSRCSVGPATSRPCRAPSSTSPTRRPATADLAFVAPPGARMRSVPRADIVRDIARFGGPRPPDTLLGFTRSRPGAPGADDRRVRRGRHPARGECALGTAGRLAARLAAARVRGPRAAGRARRRRRPGRAAADDVPRPASPGWSRAP